MSLCNHRKSKFGDFCARCKVPLRSTYILKTITKKTRIWIVNEAALNEQEDKAKTEAQETKF